jgi:hypothetical protein
VIHCIHVRRIEARDHGIEPYVLRRRQRLICTCDHRVGKGVVVKGGIGLQIVGWCEIAGIRIRPHLLQRDTEQGRPADLVTHDLQILVDVSPLLHVVGQVEVRVVEEVVGRGDSGRDLRAQSCRRSRWQSVPWHVRAKAYAGADSRNSITGGTPCWDGLSGPHGAIQSIARARPPVITEAAPLAHKTVPGARGEQLTTASELSATPSVCWSCHSAPAQQQTRTGSKRS